MFFKNIPLFFVVVDFHLDIRQVVRERIRNQRIWGFIRKSGKNGFIGLYIVFW